MAGTEAEDKSRRYDTPLNLHLLLCGKFVDWHDDMQALGLVLLLQSECQATYHDRVRACAIRKM